jgi:FAD-dependent urate hydroxylase
VASRIEAVILGCGPYGLAAAAHLRSAGVEGRVFGEPMSFWQEHMPAGMFLRSAWYASDIADPARRLTLNDYLNSHDIPVSVPVPRDRFIDYGLWFQRTVVPDLDRRRVQTIAANGDGFRLSLEDGETLKAQRVIVAGGISPFARRPAEFKELPAAMASHSCDHKNFSAFAASRVAVIGGGQSALESAALLREAGAEVEVILRAPKLRWLRGKIEFRQRMGLLRQLLYPRTDVGPPGLNQIVARPNVLRWLPSRLRDSIAQRSIRPSAANWLKSRVQGLTITTSRSVTGARRIGDRLLITLSDGTSRDVDHVIAATGYEVDIARYPFLDHSLLRAIESVGGYPRLNAGFETNITGLHFLGAPASWSFGPVTKFVSGTQFSGRALASWIVAGKRNAQRGHALAEVEG